MHTSDREGLREQLKAIAAGRGDGIDLDSQDRWVIEGLTDPAAFFRELSVLIPPDSIIYFEGVSIVPELAAFYQTNRAENAVCVVRDTIFPIPQIFHVAMSPRFIEGLLELLSKHSRQNCFHHVKAYRNERLLFTFHDAFDRSDFLIADHIPTESIQAFCDRLGATKRRERNENKRNPKLLALLMEAMDHPEKVRILWPWWKKALFFWKK
jgi:hypothetical protein